MRWKPLVWIALVAAAACGPPERPAVVDPEDAPLDSLELMAGAREASRASYARGIFLREQGDLGGALQAHRDAVRFAPADAEVRLGYAHLLVETGHVREATAFVQGAVDRFGGTAAEHLLLARLHLLADANEPALAEVDSALAHEPGMADAWYLRGRLLLAGDRAAGAYESFVRADSLQPDHPPTLEGLAASARELGRIEEARAALERALRLDPELQSARRSLAGVYRQEGRAADAKELVLQALANDPDNAERLEAAVEVLVDSGDLAGAAAVLGPYHARDALGTRMTYIYGRVLLQLDRLGAADSVLAPLADEEGLHGIEALLGDIAARSGRVEDARAHYRRALVSTPDDCAPFTSLALLEVQQARQDDARRDRPLPGAADSALAAAERVTGPESYRCNIVLAIAYLGERRYSDALPHLEAAQRLDPDNPEVLFDLALAHAELGDSDRALELSRRLLEQEPESPAALNFVGYLLAERGESLAESEALIRKALAKEPNNGYYVDSLGWVLFRRGDYARAATELERAVRITEERDPQILEHLGDVYAAMERWADADAAYAKSVAADPGRPEVAAKRDALRPRLGAP